MQRKKYKRQGRKTLSQIQHQQKTKYLQEKGTMLPIFNLYGWAYKHVKGPNIHSGGTYILIGQALTN